MANNANTPYGFQPVQSQIAYRPNQQVYCLAASVTNAIFLGDPVIKTATSSDATHGYETVILATAASANKITGIVTGFLGTDPNGAFFSLSGTPGPAYKASNLATKTWCMVETSTDAVFAVQCTGTPTASAVGKNVNGVSGQGGKYTGWSGWQVSATVTTNATAQFQVVGFLQDVSNVVGNKFPKLLVRINNSTETPAAIGI